MSDEAHAPSQATLFVTGLSGAGKTTVLRTLEDMGWEAVDNFPIRLAAPLLEMPSPGGREDPALRLALGFDTRTRGFDPQALIQHIKRLENRSDLNVATLFIDCAGTEIERRYHETRRRHPLAQDRPALAGIAQERELMEPLRRWADSVIDTTDLSASELQAIVRERYRDPADAKMTVSITSFGYSRGVPHNADLIFDMRFLQNPHWVPELRPLTGQDAQIAEYVGSDAEYGRSTRKIRDLLAYLLPLYEAQGKAYVNIAFGCTGGRHRSVFVAESFATWLREDGFSPTVMHRNLTSRPIDVLESAEKPKDNKAG